VSDPFEWNDAKAASNFLKHGVSFEEAATVFDDGGARFTFDVEHSITEDRFIIVGLSDKERLILVWHTYRDQRIRIIGARLLTAIERKAHEEKRDTR
jgi:uncharacterized DUF497 family protein